MRASRRANASVWSTAECHPLNALSRKLRARSAPPHPDQDGALNSAVRTARASLSRTPLT
jgi:hypothetical protein